MPPKPPSPTGPDPKLATEAKLCAYLEGTLPPGERTEIETYLQNNAQHRQLLKELRGTRELLQTLPAELAPPEIAEAFEQQLERSMLLDDLVLDPVPRRRGGPQLLLIVALVLLACGLGGVIYLALPGASTSTQRLAALPPPVPATGPAEPQPSTAPVVATTVPTIVQAGTPPTSEPAAPVIAVGPPTVPIAPPFEQARRFLRGQSLPPLPTALLTLSTSDPAAPQIISDYFRGSVIPVQRLSDPSEPSPAPTTQAAAVPQPASLGPTTMPAGGVPATAAATSNPGREPFLARSLSPREATRLQLELTTTFGSGAVNFYAPATWNPPQATAGPTAIVPDQSLTVTVDQLVGPGVEKTNTVRVAADGTVMLPMLLEPIPAAGGSFADLQARIAARYRDAHLISNPTVTVVPGPADSQPTAGANTPASTEAVAVPPPATAPGAIDGGQTINLLVLLLPPPQAPVTQPASP